MRAKPSSLTLPDYPPRTPHSESGSSFSISRLLFLMAAVSLAAVYRLDFLRANSFAIDSDEAIVGLMAKHILDGKGIPAFYYGQSYMGSLEALCVAVLGGLSGLTAVTLKLVPLVFSLLLIVSTYQIATRLGGSKAGIAASLLMAIPPLTLLDWSTKARGGFIELVYLGSLIFLLTLRSLNGGLRLRRTFLLGVIAGVGWWVNNQVLYFFPAALAVLCRELFLCEYRQDRRKFALQHGTCGTAGFFLGSLPFWLYNFQHHFASFEIFQRASRAEFFAHLSGFFHLSLPILFGAKRFWQTKDIFPNASLLYSLPYLCLAVVFIVSRLSRQTTFPEGVLPRRALDLIIIFLCTVPLVFAASSFGILAEAPRYVLPLYLGIFVLLGVAIAFLAGKSPFSATAVLAAMLSLNVLSAFSGGRSLPGEPLITGGDRVAKQHGDLISWLRERNITWVRANYWIGYRLAFETAETIRFLVHGEPHRVRIPEYEENAGAAAARWNLPIISVPHEAAHLEKGLHDLGYRFRRERVGPYVIFSDFGSRYGNLSLEKIPSTEIKLHASNHQETIAMMMDGSPSTRWGSGEPQKKTMVVELALSEPQTVAAIHYVVNEWRSDLPRTLEIELESAEGTRWSVGLAPHYNEVRYVISGEPDLWLWLEPHSAKKVILRELGESTKFDWSIAELEVFRMNH